MNKPIFPGSKLDRLIDQTIEALQPSLKPKANVRAVIEAAVVKANDMGKSFALSSEEKAWKRTTDLEDVIIEIARYAPGSTMMKAKALAAEVESQFEETP